MGDVISPEDHEVTPGSPEYDALMAEAFDEAQEAATGQEQGASQEERPDWLPQKFKTPEDLAAAYRTLEQKLGQKPAEPVGDDEAQEAVEAAGLDFASLEAEYLSGGLSEESYSRLEAAGIPKDVVDAYIAGQEALASQIRYEVLSEVGGADTYAEMVDWASQNLSPAEIAAYDNAVESGDLNIVKLAVEGLKARYERAFGSEPRLLNGTVSNSSEGFRSVEEMKAAMRDPRYRVDPAYRKDVERRVANSDIL